MDATSSSPPPSYLSAEWANLPPDINLSVLDKIVETIDLVRFSAVCKGWYALAKDYYHPKHQRQRRNFAPMLVIPTESRDKQRLYSVCQGKVYTNELPLIPYDSTTCCSSCNGWLATVIGDERIALFTVTLVNPFKRAVAPIPLPTLDFRSFPGVLPKVIISDDPSLNPDNYVVVAIQSPAGGFAVTKGGQNDWTYCWVGYDLSDCIFYRGQVYVVDIKGTIHSFDVTSKALKVIVHGYLDHFKKYLVESIEGDLLCVGRTMESTYVHTNKGYDTEYLLTTSFEVYKLVLSEWDGTDMAWLVELNDIGDEAMFLGDNHSLSVSASNLPGLNPNSIYYTDDWIKYGNPRVIGDGPTDMGIFNLMDKSIKPHYSINPWQRNSPPALWIVPSFN